MLISCLLKKSFSCKKELSYSNSRKFSEQEFIVSESDFLKLNSVRPPGITGHLRVRNEEMTIKACLDSCLDFLDELIIVYNDSNDNTEKILLEYANQYPEKIRLFWYPLAVSLKTKFVEDRVGYATSSKSPLLLPLFGLANFYNFGYVKTSFSHYMKIDADQVYFTEKMLEIKRCLFEETSKNVSKNSCTEEDFVSTICSFKEKYTLEEGFFNLSGINILLGKNGLSIPLGKSSTVPIFNAGIGDHFIIYPNFHDRYYESQEYEIFEHCNKIVTYLGLCWVHTGFIKRSVFSNKTNEIALSSANKVQWKDLLTHVNFSYDHMSLHEGKNFWDYDVKNYLTDDFYQKYFLSIEKYAKEKFNNFTQKNIFNHPWTASISQCFEGLLLKLIPQYYTIWALKKIRYFDEEFYLEHNKDVAKAGVDPVYHYVYFGAKEGRDPAPWFSTKAYVEQYLDVAKSKFNPFYHYLRYGVYEKRKVQSSQMEKL